MRYSSLSHQELASRSSPPAQDTASIGQSVAAALNEHPWIMAMIILALLIFGIAFTAILVNKARRITVDWTSGTLDLRLQDRE